MACGKASSLGAQADDIAHEVLLAVRWNVAGNIVFAWVLTMPAAGLIGAATYFVVRALS